MAARRFSLPNIEELSKEQERVRLLPKEGCHLIVGGPGTGKSVIALLRARRHHLKEARQDYIFLLYNRLLLEASREMVGAVLNVQTWIAWFKRQFSGALRQVCPVIDGKTYDLDWTAIETSLAGAAELPGPDAPFVIIDEGQGMPKSFYLALMDLGFERFFVVADQNQQITDQHTSVGEIADVLAVEPAERIELTDNYPSFPVLRLARPNRRSRCERYLRFG